MRSILCLPLISVGLAAQTTGDADLLKLTRELRGAVGGDSLSSAADLAGKLDDAVQERYKAWLVRDAGQRVNEVLTWLPPDIESLWVNQEPFTIKPEESLALLYGRPVQAYSTDRLMTVNGGSFYQALGGHILRLVLSAARNIGERKGIPGIADSEDVAYFYFFADPIDLPLPDDSVEGHAVWLGTAKVFVDGPLQSGVEPAQREDESWIALVRPDLLVLSNRREMLTQILVQMAGGSKSRALPSNLSEWARVNRTVSFWGLRHYSPKSKPARDQRGYDAAELPRPDGAATGVAVQFDHAKQRLEIDYLSPGKLSENSVFADSRKREFQTDQPEAGVWRLISDVRARGDFPVHFAMTMLGFGEYR
jgi:hypothetical protein